MAPPCADYARAPLLRDGNARHRPPAWRRHPATAAHESPRPESSETRTGSALVEITCPTWCGVSADEHAARLRENEGRCVHQTLVTVADPKGKRAWDEPPKYCTPIELVLLVTTDPAGREVESADVLINGLESNLEQLVMPANAIVGLGEIYRATPGRRSGL
jgi:hypothetical protein